LPNSYPSDNNYSINKFLFHINKYSDSYTGEGHFKWCSTSGLTVVTIHKAELFINKWAGLFASSATTTKLLTWFKFIHYVNNEMNGVGGWLHWHLQKNYVTITTFYY